MMGDLLPSNVVSVERWDDDPCACLLPEEAVQFDRAIESRTREFATARSCARLALSRLGLPAAPLLSGPKREPLWPPGVVGSITHCRGYRAVAVAMQSGLLALGIDAEVHEELPAEVLERVCVEQEIAWLPKAPGGVHWDRVLFSAKESVYKAWFPLTQRWLGFEDVAVTFGPNDGTFHACLLIAPPEIDGQTVKGFTGRFLIRKGLVLTATVVPGPTPPEGSSAAAPADE
jgi:4'-phosphopantetheinyl transferase EntD